MNLEDTVSVIIPCYNCEDYISETLESFIHQTIKPLEIILVDDGSSDNTIDILHEMERRYTDMVKVIRLEENKGVSYARNHGVDSSKGKYILFMDSDDIAEYELIEEYQSRLKELNSPKKSEYVLCYSSYVQIDGNNNIISNPVRGIQVKPREILGYEFIRNYISTSGVLIKKEDFSQSGGFNEELIYSEDWDLWLRLAHIGGFAYVDKPLIKVRRYKNNKSSKIGNMLDGEKMVLKQYGIKYIKEAILKRELDIETNIIDYVSILYRLECWERGFRELKDLLNQGCNYYNLYFYLGLYYLNYKEVNQALECFNKTIDIKPEHGAALNNIGALYLLMGNKKLGEKYLLLAIKYFQSYMDANDNYKLLLNKDIISLNKLKFTWRELRSVLTTYNG